MLLLLAATLAAQQPVTPPPGPQRQPITADLSKGATFTFKIAPDLPSFTFKIIPDPYPTDEYGNPHSLVREVQVFAGNSTQPLQNLEGCEFLGMEAPPRNFDWFRALDMNFDGYQDIYMLVSWGATGNQMGCVWLFDPAKRRFAFSAEFSDLGRFELDPATRTITTHSNGGMVGTVFRAAKYAVVENRPVLMFTVAQDWDFKKKQYPCVVEQWRDGGNTPVALRDVWATPKEDFDCPCDPADPFHDLGDK